VGTRASTSPADTAIRRAKAFLRVVRDETEPAGTSHAAAESWVAADGGSAIADERQMLLPHVSMDVAGDARAAAGDPAAADTPVEKTIWGSPAGKKHLAPKLVKLIPAHKTYVEPFAGSAAVFFAKPPSEKEVLGDADPEIAFAYRALSTLTDAELGMLKKKDWTGRKTLYRAMQEAKPRSKIEKLYRFLYLSHFAHGALRGRSYNAADEGVAARTIARIEKHRDRLRGVAVRSAHYADVVKEFDGKNTFFFLDPPYRATTSRSAKTASTRSSFARSSTASRASFWSRTAPAASSIPAGFTSGRFARGAPSARCVGWAAPRRCRSS
jgi:site-specific DNA-adenine methylase